jgi:short-subunit dehydrogenase
VTLLINNAGIDTHTPLLEGDLDAVSLEMETTFFGTLPTGRTPRPRPRAGR